MVLAQAFAADAARGDANEPALPRLRERACSMVRLVLLLTLVFVVRDGQQRHGVASVRLDHLRRSNPFARDLLSKQLAELVGEQTFDQGDHCLLYTSPSPRDRG